MQQFLFNIHHSLSYAAEAYSSDTTGKLPDMLLGSIPEAKAGVTARHILALMWKIESECALYNTPIIGHSTDSAANALAALIRLNSPSTYYNHMEHVVYSSLDFLGLPRDDFMFLAPFLRASYPSIAYPCWDRSGRTAVRNLMNTGINIVAEVLPSMTGACNFQEYRIAIF